MCGVKLVVLENVMAEGDDVKRDDVGKGGALINFSIQDVLGVGPASKNIMDALRAGLGDLLSPWLEARRGAAEQRTAKGWLKLAKQSGLAIEEFDITRIEGRTDYRVRAEAMRQQESREAVVLYALAELPALADQKLIGNETPIVGPEWLNRFWRLAQDVSSDDLRSLWGHLLARQATGAGQVSARTLESLSLLDRWEIDELTRIASFVLNAKGDNVDEMGIIVAFNLQGEHHHRAQGLIDELQSLVGSGSYAHFATIGVFSTAGWSPSLKALSSATRLTIGCAPFELWTGPPEPSQTLFGWALSRTGRDVIELIRTTPPDPYIAALTEGFQRMGTTLRRKVPAPVVTGG